MDGTVGHARGGGQLSETLVFELSAARIKNRTERKFTNEHIPPPGR